ncbi:UTRA domain-containing protein [Brachybacterium sp. Z12]|uniref:UTRA domain-containing protein n=1 Tax=Brachybacterium sp. Z12 TaxID=2759167 RepID=UPI0037BEE244
MLTPGSRLENELALSKRLRLSRPTVRQGIQELVGKGMLVRKRGVDEEHAELLDEELGAALLTMERKSFANDGTVVEYGYHVYRASRYSFEVTLVDS